MYFILEQVRLDIRAILDSGVQDVHRMLLMILYAILLYAILLYRCNV